MKVSFSGKQFGIFSAVIILIALAAFYFTQNPMMPNASTISGQQTVGSVTSNAVGNPAPDFTAVTVDLSSGTTGKNITLSDLKATGKPTILYFWATWCPFCRDELTKLKTIYPQYQDKVNFVVVDVDVEEDAATIAKDVNSRGYFGTFTLAPVPMLQAYKIYDTSTKYVIGRNGTILFSGSGEINDQYWINLFNQAISS